MRGLFKRGTVVGCALALAYGAGAAVPASAEKDPPYLPIVDLLPPLPGKGGRDPGIPCEKGSPRCVDRTLRRMHRMLRRDGCDHKGLFLANYIVVTEAYAKIARTPNGRGHSGYFDDPVWLAREDSLFARQYFAARKWWSKPATRDRVDPAWRVAFRAADQRSMTGLGDLILGINAHVNNDMPFMIAATGTRDDDGKSHKKDHDLFNRNLSGTFDDVLEDLARRYDPTANVDVPGTELEKTVIYQLLALWREGVWRNAERLEAAETQEQRERVAASIQNYALAQAKVVEPLFGVSDGGAARQAYCEAQLKARQSG
jgi:hypothetical protein